MSRHRPAALNVAMFVVCHAGAVVAAEPIGTPTSTELVELLKNDPVAVDLVRDDAELVKRLNPRPTVGRVIKELRTEPSLFLYRIMKTLHDPWVLFGFGAQALFFMRFMIQWIASERRKRSHVPVAFWYFSLAGGITLFAYAVRRLDPVFMIGQGLGCFIYIRNLILIHRRSTGHRERLAQRAARAVNSESSVDKLDETASTHRMVS